MKILHTADLHLGRQFNGLSLERDHQAILDQIVAAILEHLPDVLIVAGDIYDRATPPASAVGQFSAFLTRIRQETATSVVMIAGNHDSGDRIGAMAILADRQRALICGPLDANEKPLVLYDRDGPVVFTGLPFGYEYAARACFNDETIASPEDVVRAQMLAARPHVPAGARWVVVAHAFVTGGHISEVERPLARAGGVEAVDAGVFDGAHYVALGHLHRPQRVGAEHIRYSGAPLAYGFDEAGDVKSMALVTLAASGLTDVTLLPFTPIRGVRILRGALTDLLKEPPSSDIVKVILTDATPQIDPMNRLRAVFPNACQLTYERLQRAPEVKSAIQTQRRVNEPMQLITDFILQVRGEGVVEQEQRLIAASLEVLQHEERAA